MTNSLLRTAALLAVAAAVAAQGPAGLVSDINVTPPTANPSSNARAFYVNGGLMLFQGTDAAHGSELWRSNGTPAGTFMVKDINPGSANAAPFGFVELSPGIYLFQASEASTASGSGGELWRTDGTAAGTSLVADIAPGPTPSMQFPVMVNMGGVVYFSANDGLNGTELWRSDGTTAGTYMVKDLNTAALNASPNDLRVIGSTLFFRAAEASVGSELFKSDGTAAGTVLVYDINPGPTGSSPGNVVVFNNRVYFGASEPVAGNELWSSDGTTTALVVDLNPGTASSSMNSPVVWNGAIYFSANDGVAGSELWKHDGTNTTLIDVVPGPVGSFCGFFTPVGSNLFFQATDPTVGSELFKYDGTTASLVADIWPGMTGTTPNSSGPNRMAEVAGLLVFEATDGVFGREPWRSDGTAAGTFILADIAAGTANALSNFFTSFLGYSYFQAVGPAGQELYRTDGTTVGTTLFKDLNPPVPSSNPATIVDSRGVQVAIFAADDGMNGLELWRSDGTAAGTFMVKHINNLPDTSAVGLLTAVGNKVFFTADDGTFANPVNGRELWVTDGTLAGTIMLDIRPGTASASPFGLVEYKGRCFFAANDGLNGNELWASDGTQAGTVMVADIATPGTASSSPSSLTVVNNLLFFAANDGSVAPAAGNELWATDGTGAGTYRVADINAGTASSTPQTFIAFADKLYFTATVAATGRELYVSDGTAAGTSMVLDINAGTGNINPTMLGISSGRLFFAASIPASGLELYSTDGTAAGTALVKDIATGAPSSNPIGFADLGSFAVFFANDGVTGFEPWRTDGTAPGTTQIADIMAGPLGSLAGTYVVAVKGANRAVFAASDGINGAEIWRTDGTLAGTVMHHNIAPGGANSNPTTPVQVGGLLMFAASDGTTGVELWAMASTASASPYGVACPGSLGRYPHISGSGGAPTLGNAGFGVRVTNGLPSSVSFLLLFAGRMDLPLGSCTLYGNPALLLFALSTPTDVNGVGILPIAIPNAANLASLQLFGQHAVLDPNGSYSGVIALTEGVKILVNPN